MIRVADYIADYLARAGLDTVFTVTGGGAMHLNDGFARHPDLECIYQHHEQACAIAAEGYYRVARRPAIVNVTTGPGGTNAISGVYGAWTDSVAMVVVSGQVKTTTLARGCEVVPRQLGDQEVDIIPLVESVTKYAVIVTDPESIGYHLDRALAEATSGRPGPVWLDVPIDIQSARVERSQIEARRVAATPPVHPPVDAAVESVWERLLQSKRPAIMLGSGVWIAEQGERIKALAAQFDIPLLTAWNAHDLVENRHPCYAGRPGTVGDRAGNFVAQSADLLLILGSRLNIRQISYNWEQFAHRAEKIMVDIDVAELCKPTLSIDLPIEADLSDFVPALCSQAARSPLVPFSDWLAWCRRRVDVNPVVRAEFRSSQSPVNPYVFIDDMSPLLRDDEVLVCANATAAVVTFQALKLRRGQRLFSNSGSASMGYDLPAAIGACFAHQRRRVICMAGDGSIMMNLQELQTIVHYRLPLKIVLLNNCGYLSIRQTQQAYFPDNLSGFDADTGVMLPDFSELANAFGLSYLRCERHDGNSTKIEQMLAMDGPVLLEVMIDPSQAFEPKLASRMNADGSMDTPALEDMYPFLPREELAANMWPADTEED